MVTTAFLADVLIVLGEVFLFQSNPYMGIIVWVILPAIGLFGLLLIPFGLWRRAKRSGVKGIAGVASLVKVIQRRHFFQLILGLSLLNLVIFGTVGYRALHFMESPQFCGVLCHEVMGPEYNIYTGSPHSEVDCVSCHVGSGIGHLLKSKLDGTRQLLAVLTESYSRPIPTPIHNLRPAREVCGACHFPESFHGNMIKVIPHYEADENNTRTVTILNMKVGGGTGINKKASGIHWHVDKGSAIRYYANDEKREQILQVEHTDLEGNVRIWRHSEQPMPEHPEAHKFREMDCVDCHNRPTHVFLPPDQALDQWFEDGLLDASIPWLRAICEDLIAAPFGSNEEVMQRAALLPERYQQKYPGLWPEFGPRVRATVEPLHDMIRMYVYPEMNLQWNTYPSLLGHPTEHTAACFRCHNGVMLDQEGVAITTECEACHFVLADKEQDPMILRILEDR
jgi:hypothetical protein